MAPTTPPAFVTVVVVFAHRRDRQQSSFLLTLLSIRRRDDDSTSAKLARDRVRDGTFISLLIRLVVIDGRAVVFLLLLLLGCLLFLVFLVFLVTWFVECAISSRSTASHRRHFGAFAGRLRVRCPNRRSPSTARRTVRRQYDDDDVLFVTFFYHHNKNVVFDSALVVCAACGRLALTEVWWRVWKSPVGCLGVRLGVWRDLGFVMAVGGTRASCASTAVERVPVRPRAPICACGCKRWA